MSMESEKRQRNLRIIQIIALLVCIIAALYIGYVLYTRYMEQKAYEDVKEDVLTLEEVENAEFNGERDGDAPELPEEFADGVRTSVDFDKLQSYNEELVAWIQIPDTNIDYPVARHEGEDQEYYLNHDMYGNAAYAGCIYMEDSNQEDFSDNNTILYGHNMKNGSMFRNLHEFAESEFFEEHPYIYIFTPGHRLTYEIFASYVTDSVKLSAAFDFSNQEEYESYLDSLQDIRSMGAMVREEISLSGEDKILTLSTCIGGETDKRYLVQGVLIDDVETE